MLAILLSASVALAPCPGSTTPEVNVCLAGRYCEADASLNQYYKKALQRLRREGDQETVRLLVDAERAWLAYRDKECGAVSASFKGGTIAPAYISDCLLRITRLQTYALWRDWLTYPDSTPSLLPRPGVESAI